MNPLEKKLIKSSIKSVDESEAIVNDVKMLLEVNAQEERRVLASVGLDNDLIYAEDKNADILIRNATYDKFGVPVVHINEIKQLCEDYHLYMRKANQYVGTVPLETGAELNRFCKEHNIPLPASSSYTKFYIIAPPKMFKGYRSFSRIVKDAIIWSKQEAKRKRLARQIDPILVYQTQNSDYFAIVKSWGSDFTPLRRLEGMLTRPSSIKMLSIMFNALVVYGIFKLTAFGWNHFSALADKSTNDAWWLVSILIGFIGLVATVSWFTSDEASSFRNKLKSDLTNDDPIQL